VCRQVEAGRPLERNVRRRDAAEAGDAVGTGLTLGGRHEVPDARLEDEAQRLDQALHLAAGAPVADVQPLAIPDRIGQDAEMGDRLGGVEPAGGIQMEAFDQARRTSPQLRGEGRQHLEARSGHDGAESQLGGRAGQA
jgi:hypothetical protein